MPVLNLLYPTLELCMLNRCTVIYGADLLVAGTHNHKASCGKGLKLWQKYNMESNELLPYVLMFNEDSHLCGGVSGAIWTLT